MKKIISNILLGIIAIFSVLTLSSPLFKYKYYTVVSDSMYPSIPKYSLVYVKLIDTNNVTLKENQVIAFYSDNIPVMHRIVEIYENEIITHGDNNRIGVNENVNYSDVIGIVKFSIPLIGVLFINRYIIPTIVLFIFIIIILKEIIKEQRNRR